MPKSALLPCPADRRETLEAIAHALRGGTLSDPFEDLAAWVAGVEVVETWNEPDSRLSGPQLRRLRTPYCERCLCVGRAGPPGRHGDGRQLAGRCGV